MSHILANHREDTQLLGDGQSHRLAGRFSNPASASPATTTTIATPTPSAPFIPFSIGGDEQTTAATKQQQHPLPPDSSSTLRMISGSIYGPSASVASAAGARQAQGDGPDHFSAFLHSPQAHSSPRSPASARDFSPELREMSPDVLSPVATTPDDHDIPETDPDRTLVSAANGKGQQSDDSDWTKYFHQSLLSGGIIGDATAKGDAPVLGQADCTDHMADFFTQAQAYFAGHTIQVTPPTATADGKASATAAFFEQAIVASPLAMISPSSDSSPPDTVDFFTSHQLGPGALFGPRSTSLGAASSDYEVRRSSIGSSDSSLTTPPWTGASYHSPVGLPSLDTFSLGTSAGTEHNVMPGSNPANDVMMVNGCRTVFQMIVDGHAPELVDDFVGKLYSVTGQMVPTRIFLEAQEEKKRRLWSQSNTSVSSFNSDSASSSDSDEAVVARRPVVNQKSTASSAASTTTSSLDSSVGISPYATSLRPPSQLHHPQPPRPVTIAAASVMAAAAATTGTSAAAPPKRKSASSTTTAGRRGPYAKRGVGRGGSAKKRFACEVCHKQFDRAFNLKTHMATHDTVRDKPYLCPLTGCRKDFARKHDCQRHFRTIHVKRGEASLAMLDLIVNLHGDDDDDDDGDGQHDTLFNNDNISKDADAHTDEDEDDEEGFEKDTMSVSFN
ncbi:hypothetical protein K437DRAFT_260517 [Tilletiaria anomala UBC 951]|uniref:C2H2-type domain-containing protein n=1 Tax=Tilletiaria anomala (strain ATCC 24038 / CBS 436.72 / UBC 951) TaxID=1037660 RepID=A0A066WHU6_TILAU|nr:uncharacterized protein K437DRAFT_260517 [Tilletiaria anomala UBC 951]KDN53592.1 hypothetical protein K437DRAFT_260517 [Tilletiaria anomala UBC 951]